MSSSAFPKKIAMSNIFHMPPWSAMLLMWGQCYFNNGEEIFWAKFTIFWGKSQDKACFPTKQPLPLYLLCLPYHKKRFSEI